MDLYKLYKNFYQRAHRNPTDEALVEMEELAHHIAKRAYQLSLAGNDDERSYLTLLADSEQLEELELERGGFTVFFARKLPDAIRNGDYTIDVPYTKRHSWGIRVAGWVYVMTSDVKPGMVKLGATTMDPQIRANKYQSKYGYSVDLVHTVYDENPFYLEKLISDFVKSKRVAGNVHGDSNEWYVLKVDDAISLLNRFKTN